MHDDIIEKKKRWLYRYRNNQAKIIRLKEKVEKLDERILSINSPRYSDMPKGNSQITIADYLSDKDDITKRIKRLSVNGNKIKEEILEAIDTLERPREIEILEFWFIDGYNADQINEILGISTTYIYRLYSRALKKIDIPDLLFES